MQHQTNKFWGYALIVMILFAFVSSMDFNDEKEQEAHYCHMVALWKADAIKGIHKRARAGWPPFKEEVNCASK
jgi:hypothetical protein